MESSDLQHQLHSSSLMRNRSAPSSYFTDLLDREFCQQFFDRPSSPETERIFARFMNSDDDDFDPPKPIISNLNQSQNQNPNQNPNQNQNQQSVSYAPASQPSYYQSGSKPPLPSPTPTSQGMGTGGGVPYSMGMSAPFPPMRTGGVANSGLLRQSSSPAGFFSNINIDTSVFGAIRGGSGTFGGNNTNTNTNNNNSASGNVESTGFGAPVNRLKRTSSTVPMSPIAEIDDKTMVTNANGINEDNNDYFPTMSSWDDSDLIGDTISGLKRVRDDDVKPFAGLNPPENQNMESGNNRPPMLAHHLSLPKTQAEMAAIEKFLQFQDSVPCKIRAKRGCATHPRSIAERVRRTRISERMRKLQELVPNMEKQTNTADMLDLAVEYIKDLQNQVQTLDDCRAKCTCSNKNQKLQQ